MSLQTALTNLLKVKSIVTILTTIVFCALLLMGVTIPQEFMVVYTAIIAFYFGTQAQKTQDGATNGYSKPVSKADSGTNN